MKDALVIAFACAVLLQLAVIGFFAYLIARITLSTSQQIHELVRIIDRAWVTSKPPEGEEVKF